MRVLLVDDESVNRRLGARMLERLQCSYRLLEDGSQVAGLLREDPAFDAILMDIVMQHSDGAEVCRQLRQDGCVLPLIAMTGNTRCVVVCVGALSHSLPAPLLLTFPRPPQQRARRTALYGCRL